MLQGTICITNYIQEINEKIYAFHHLILTRKVKKLIGKVIGFNNSNNHYY